jgi:hypothetical protein
MKIKSAITFECVCELSWNFFRDFRIKEEKICTIVIHFVQFLSTSYTFLNNNKSKVKQKLMDLQSDWTNCAQMKELCMCVGPLHSWDCSVETGYIQNYLLCL